MPSIGRLTARIMQLIKTIDNFLFACEKFLVVFFFSALVVGVTFNIISRNLFQVSFDKILEFSPVFVVWTAFLGATVAMKKKRHLRLELFLRYCPEKFQKLSYFLVSSFGIIITGILLIASFQFVENEISIFGARGWLSVIFPIFFGLTCFRYFTGILESLNGIFIKE